MYSLRNLCITLVFASLLLTGCGGNLFEGLADDGTKGAKMEAARIALDEGDYGKAVLLLEELCGTDTANLTCDDTARADLASAYVARATGLDVLKLIEKAEEAAANLTATGSFTTVSTLLPIGEINNCVVSDPRSCTIQEDLGKAIAILNGLLPHTVPSDPTPEQKNRYLQLSVASAVDIAVTIGLVSGGLDPTTGLPITPPSSIKSADVTTRVSRDINNIVLGLEGAGIPSTNLSEDINTIETSIDSNKRDGVVEDEELIKYINSLKLK